MTERATTLLLTAKAFMTALDDTGTVMYALRDSQDGNNLTPRDAILAEALGCIEATKKKVQELLQTFPAADAGGNKLN